MAVAVSWVGRFTDWWMPPLEDPEVEARYRFCIQAWMVAWPFAVGWSVLYATMGIWGQVVLNGLMVVLGPLTLWGMKRTGSLTPWFHITMVGALLLYGPGMLTQTPIDETALFFVLIIPLVAGFVFGWRGAMVWTVLTAICAVGSLLLGHAGYTLAATDPTPLLSKSLNTVTALVMSAAFASRFYAVRRAAFERAEAASRAKSLFLASISHEIRTPMNGVLGMTDVMLHEVKDPVAREQLGVIARSGRLLVSLINDLLDVTKLEAQRLTLEVSPFDLHALCADVERLFAAQGREKGVRFGVWLAPGTPVWLRGDALRLQQVLLNLVSNGLKFTVRGEVKVTVRPLEGDTLEFSVDDTGVGIAPEVLPRLFSIFEQADASTTRRYGGTGLGLALSRQLVALMGGELKVSSEEGRGSRFFFTVWLPRADPPAPVEAPAPPVGVTRARVLVVDDNAINLQVATSLVRKAGFHADAVTSGADAVRAVGETPYAAVLMDCHMPEMDGFEATRRIRALDGAHARVRIIAVTASTSAEDLDACLRSGMNEVLAKPVSLEALQKALAG